MAKNTTNRRKSARLEDRLRASPRQEPEQNPEPSWAFLGRPLDLLVKAETAASLATLVGSYIGSKWLDMDDTQARTSGLVAVAATALTLGYYFTIGKKYKPVKNAIVGWLKENGELIRDNVRQTDKELLITIGLITLSMPAWYFGISVFRDDYRRAFEGRPVIVKEVDPETKKMIERSYPASASKIPAPLIVEIVNATERTSIRDIYSRQLQKFNAEYAGLVQENIKMSDIALDKRVDIDTFFGIMRAESGMYRLAVSPVVAGGPAQFIVSTARQYLKVCGARPDQLYVRDNFTRGMKDPKKRRHYWTKYGEELKRFVEKKGENVHLYDVRFDKKIAACMMVHHIADLARQYPDDDPEMLEARYNAGSGFVNRKLKAAITYTGQDAFEAVAPFFQNPEPEKYPWRVEAGRLIRKKSPDGKVLDPFHYLSTEIRTGLNDAVKEDSRTAYQIPQQQKGMLGKMRSPVVAANVQRNKSYHRR